MNLFMALPSENWLTTRYSLLSRLQNWDDQDSWRDFFDTYWHLIYSFALKSGLTEAEAQDVVQETIISVAKDIQKFRRDQTLGTFKGWLKNLTRWRIADQLHKRTPLNNEDTDQRFRGAEMMEVPGVADAGLESIWEQEWESNLLETAMRRVKRRVKEEHYQMFDLYVLKHWPVRKVAQTLDVSVGQVYLAKHRISLLIRREIRALEQQW
jgi:RNA polymerase sigma-70 factor (ECF subfamily)